MTWSWRVEFLVEQHLQELMSQAESGRTNRLRPTKSPGSSFADTSPGWPAVTSGASAPVLVVTGAPGVGKSTVARKIAERLPVCACIEADELHRLIISGGEWPSADTPRSVAQLELRTRHAATLALNFSQVGIPTIIDEVLGLPVQVKVLEEGLTDCNLAIVGLTATSETIDRRDSGRQRHTAHLYEGVEQMIRRTIEAIWIDTTHLTVNETVEELLSIVGW